ncbi:MAG: hypothetical protein OXG91_03550 [bacterium]|nr:hypothetical protein [bacterium]
MGKSPGKQHLPPTVAPGLPDDACGDTQTISLVHGPTEHPPDIPLVAIEGDQRSGVENVRRHPNR